MVTVISKPLTFRSRLPLPDHFLVVAEEGRLSYEFAQRYPGSISEHLVRLHVTAKLFASRARADVIISGRYGELFALCQGVFPLGRKPLILMDIEWFNIYEKPLRSHISKVLHRMLAWGTARIQVFCEAEAENYAAYFGIGRDKFVWVPYCTDLDNKNFEVRDEDYLFTGGLHHRDYETLYHAVKDLPVRVMVAAPKGGIPREFVSKNMTLLGVVSRDAYFEAMAKAKAVVLSLQPGIMRCPGVITYVSAMRMGKCVVVNETEGTRSYMSNGATGIVVEPGNPEALKEALRAVLQDDGTRGGNRPQRSRIRADTLFHVQVRFRPGTASVFNP